MGSTELSDDELIEGWRVHIRKFQNELDCSLSDPGNIWHVFDWVGALHFRNRVDRRFGSRQRPNLVHDLDDLFRSFTVDVGRDWIPDWGPHYEDKRAARDERKKVRQN